MPYTKQLRHNTVLFLIVLAWEVENSTKTSFLLSPRLCAEEFSRSEYSWPFVKKQEGTCAGRKKNKIFRYLHKVVGKMDPLCFPFLPLAPHIATLCAYVAFPEGREKRKPAEKRILWLLTPHPGTALLCF